MDDERYLALAEQYGQLEEDLGQLRDSVARLADQLNKQAQPPAPGGSALWWPSLTDTERVTAWEDLAQWMRVTIPTHLPGVATALTKCWAEHPNVIDEVTMLHATWKAAYFGPKATAADVGTWLDRWAPGAEKRIQTALRDCRQGHELRAAPIPGLS